MYRSYGIHALLNAVSEPEGVGAAVLIRALEPLDGLDAMRARRGLERIEDLCSGPGKLTQALGIGLDLNGTSLQDGPIRFGPRPEGWADVDSIVPTRIGITKAVDLPWRFCAARSRSVSRPWPPGRCATRSPHARRLAGRRLWRRRCRPSPRRGRVPASAQAWRAAAVPAAPGSGSGSACGAAGRCLRDSGRAGVSPSAGPPGACAPPDPSGSTTAGVVVVVVVALRRQAELGPALGFALGVALLDHLQGLHHELAPDQRGEGAAGDRLAAELGLHRLQAVGVADPHGDRELVGEADEPGVAVVLGRAGLAGGELPEGGALARCRS